MAFDEQLATRVRKLLSRHRNVVERKMMGSLAFMVDGSMACAVNATGLLIGVTANERERTLSLQHVSPMKVGTRTMSGFVRVAVEGLRSEAGLSKWIERGLQASTVRKKKPTRRKSRA
jgi:TfoX/Sxy family transcriptional regulator of competence genes